MKVLYCVSEVAPIIKVGGLGDVAGSLPKALSRLGVDIKIIVPAYEEVLTRITTNKDTKSHESFRVEFAGRKEEVVVWEMNLPNSEVPVYFLENETYLSKNGHQAFAGTEKEIERFAFFSKSIATWLDLMGSSQINTNMAAADRSKPQRLPGCQHELRRIDWFPDLVHLNDWHTSLVPLLLPKTCHLATLLTIHNLSYQGIAGLDLLAKLGLKPDSCEVLKWDAQNRDIGILMEGIIHADFVNTVSPTYAKEIMTPEFGWGIEEVLRGKEGRVVGILNGIDCEVWNPETDHYINFKFQISNFKLGKAENKKFLQKELGLAVNEKIPVLAFVGRLEPRQKGLDILYEAMEKLLGPSFQFVLLGSGDKNWEEKFNCLCPNFSGRPILCNNYRFINKFDERLAHQIYAGADLILMPSRFEPCGLPQMIGMRYGTLPIVRKTGGLADTVRDGVTGFVFDNYASDDLLLTIERALKVYYSQINSNFHSNLLELSRWDNMIKNAMQIDFSWDRSAHEYFNLYKKILNLWRG